MKTIRSIVEDLQASLNEQDEQIIRTALKRMDKVEFGQLQKELEAIHKALPAADDQTADPRLREASSVLLDLLSGLKDAMRSGRVRDPRGVALDFRSAILLLKSGGNRKLSDRLRDAIESRARAPR